MDIEEAKEIVSGQVTGPLSMAATVLLNEVIRLEKVERDHKTIMSFLHKYSGDAAQINKRLKEQNKRLKEVQGYIDSISKQGPVKKPQD
jgi:hypothetical protein